MKFILALVAGMILSLQTPQSTKPELVAKVLIDGRVHDPNEIYRIEISKDHVICYILRQELIGARVMSCVFTTKQAFIHE